MKQLFLALAALAFAHVACAAVNLNTATKDDLVGLPGIGPAKAQAIVDYRNQHGPFRSVDELRKVKGIGEKLFLQVRPEVVISGPGSPRGAGAPAARAETKSEVRGDAKAAPRGDGGAIARDDKPRK